MRKITERSHCYALMDWANLHPICKDFLFHIENERKCSPAQGHMRKRMGVRKGVVDYFLPVPVYPYHGIWLEMKLPGKKLSEDQQIWLDKMNLMGYKTAVCFSWEEAKNAITDYLNDSKCLP